MSSTRQSITILFFIFLALALSASAQDFDDEFCGSSAPPAHVMKAWQNEGRVGHACCTDSICRCTSMICGGPEASLEDQDIIVIQLGERLPEPKTKAVQPSGRELPEAHLSITLIQPALEPPTPPPPKQ